ncbi:MAG: alpha-2-macroglobulin family protein, partial [Saprospiraceae bacterium]
MKNLLILVSTGILILVIASIYAFSNTHQNENMINFNKGDYEKEWKIIEELERKGLPKSALEKVELLYARAKKENNPSQIVKTLIYRGKYESQLEEDGLVNSIYKFEQEMEASEPLVKSILQSILAEMYTRYYQENSWKYNNRSETVDFDQKDIRTWDLRKLMNAASDLYHASLTFEAAKSIEISDFAAITTKAVNTDKLRPTLYDFLTHRALEYFINDQNYLTEPAFKFYINQDEAFAKPETFANFKFETKDEESNKYNTLLLFQRLIKFHLKDKSPTALVDIDLKRLEFVHNNAVLGHKDQLYLKALEALEKEYALDPVASEIIYRRAQYHLIKGRGYQPNPENIGKDQMKRAYDLATKGVKWQPKSYGARLCKNIINEIENKSLSLQTEKIVVPQKAFKALVSYKNLDKIYLKVVRMESEKKFNRMNEKETVEYFNRLKAFKSWEQSLPNDGDFNPHALEIKIDELPMGKFVIVASDNARFSYDKNAISFMTVKVSQLSYMDRSEGGNTTFVVMDRSTGEPLADVEAKFYSRNYNRKKDIYEETALSTARTDANGFVQAKVSDRQNYIVKFKKGEDLLSLNDNYRNYSRLRRTRKKVKTHFFLDRGIYRPGQTVFFKGMVLEYDEKRMPEIIPNKKVQVDFYDVNGQEVAKLNLTTNSYGTFNGSFVAPKTGLLGRMSIKSSEGNTRKYFRVEEYKRPKFELSFEALKGSFKLNENVEVSGVAKAYAGNNIDGAKVKYRVVRTVRYPYLPWYYRGGFNPWGGGQNQMEITNGETTTDAEGKFKVNFKALADLSIPAARQPEFNFQVTVDVVDITGETQSNQTSVRVGYVALEAGISFTEGTDIPIDEFKSLTVFTNNLNGVFTAAQGQVKLELLKSPGRVLRSRYWKVPDVFVYTEEAHNKLFPHDIYQKENDFRNWKIAETVLTKNFDSAKDKVIALDKTDWKVGHYRVTLKTKDQFGAAIEFEGFITLFDLDAASVPGEQINFSYLPKSKIEPGEDLLIYQGSAGGETKVLFEIARNNETIRQEWLSINGIKKIQEMMKKSYRGGLSYSMHFVKFNRFFSVRERVDIPWSNKDLQITYATFRDKLSPGQKEEWQLTISGNEKDKVAAEMLATMYDASLDVFAKNDYSLTPFPSSYGIDNYSSRNFGQVRSRLIAKRWMNNQPLNINRMYRRLNWFNFNFYAAQYRSYGYLNDASAAGISEEAEYETLEAAPVENKKASRPKKKLRSAVVAADQDGMNANSAPPPPPAPEAQGEGAAPKPVKVRTNLNETVFFFPELLTDADGNIIVKFTMNEALTRWKFLALAHTKDLKIGISEKEVVTQKELMVMPNPPRFFRENDEIEFTAKVSNLTKETLSGDAVLELYDALTMKPIDDLLSNEQKQIQFTAKAGQSDRLAWKLKIPLGKDIQAITHRVIARAGNYADGEESTLPVLTN